MQQEIDKLRQEADNLETQIDKAGEEKINVEKKLVKAKEEVVRVQEVQEMEKEKAELKQKATKEECGTDNLIQITEMVDMVIMMEEMEGDIKMLMNEKTDLEEKQKELENQMVEENGQDVTKLTESSQKTFAEEVEEISENKLRKSLEEQQSANTSLSGYIDTVLMNIMERYPNMLEIRK